MSSTLDVVRGVCTAVATGDIPHEFVADGATVVALGAYSGIGPSAPVASLNAPSNHRM
jgi:hypothetical protein